MHLLQLHISLASIWGTATSGTFWIELFIHWVAFCSSLDRFVLVPMEEWAHDPDNCSTDSFKKIHSFAQFIRAWGSLNKRANLGNFAVAELRQIQAKDDAQKEVDKMPPPTP